jgi:alkanesulfonate monooxygenase SsuD/methylene tetrahydromethanopterin reductase-like flavin-dependent oxidoreductase (luciferase family)
LANRAHQNFRFTLETVPPEERPGVQRFMDAFDVTKKIDERSDPGLITDYLQQRFAIAGTPEECAQRIGELARRGIINFLLTLPPKAYYEVMRKWATAVMPRVRAAESAKA